MSPLSPRSIRLLLPLAALLSLFSASLAPHSTAAPSNPALPGVRLALNLSPISALPLIAQERGLFTQQGLQVQITNFTSGRQALETVLGGGAEIATAAESPVTAATFAQQKVALIARMEYSDLKTLVSVEGVSQPAELRGKRIAYTAGTGSEVYTYSLLERAGLKKSDVTLVNLRPQDMIAAAASGSIDAYNIWEPFIANGQRALGAKARVLSLPGTYTETFNVVVTEAYARAHPAVNVAFLRALIEAETWLKAHREEAITLVARLVGMNREELAAIWGDYVFDVALDPLTLSALEKHARWRIDTNNAAGGAKTLPDFRQVIFSEPLRQIAPERVKL